MCLPCHLECRPMNGSTSCHGQVKLRGQPSLSGSEAEPSQVQERWQCLCFPTGRTPVPGMPALPGRRHLCVTLSQRGESGAADRVEIRQRDQALPALQRQLHSTVSTCAATASCDLACTSFTQRAASLWEREICQPLFILDVCLKRSWVAAK